MATDNLLAELLDRGVSRRDFLKFCSAMASSARAFFELRADLANYVTKYVTKARDAFVDGKVHRSWTWVYFGGTRMFAIRNSILENSTKAAGKRACMGRMYLKDGIEYAFKRS